MAELNQLIDKLSPQKRALLAKLLKDEGIEVSQLPITPQERNGDAVPLSFAQQRLWFFDQFRPGNVAYNLPIRIRLTGSLNIEALKQSLNEIIKRHEILRTTFATEDGQPVQVITPHLTLALPVVDLQKLSEPQRQAEAERLAAEEAHRSFDLTKGPLIRAVLLVLSKNKHILLVTMHHIVFDGWSVGTFNQELGALYQAFCTDQPSPLPELSIQYADFAQWQRQWLQGEVLKDQLSYWKQQLSRNLPVLELPTDHPRPAVQTLRGTYQIFTLPQPLITDLKVLSQQEEATLFTTFLAAVKILLYRYSRQEDILVGIPIAGRNRAEIEDLIGLFVNTLVLRTDLSGNPTFREFLQQVREVTLEAYAHQDLPFEKVVEELQPERDLSRNPLFQVSLTMFNFRDNQMELPDLTLTPLKLLSVEAQFDLALYVMEEAEGLSIMVNYNTDLFEEATITRLGGHLQTLLKGIVANPEQPIATLPLLTTAERRQLLITWNDTERDYPLDSCLHQLFEAQVERTPEAVAVIFGDQQLTYKELNRRANQLAHYLQTQGAEPESLVGVCMERSLEMVIGLYGILKAGGAYVPLDPTYPQERLAFMVEDAQVPVLLTQQHLIPRLPEHQAQVLCLDTEWETIAQESEANPQSPVTAQNLAYVIFTSGSTGRPKGAMNPHRAICNRLLWMQDEYNLTPSDRVIQKTPFSFDVSVWEFFWPLLVGAQLVVARPEGHKDSAYLIKLIVEQEITTIHFVPSMLQIFLGDKDVERCTSLKRVICSGEALPYDLQERFFKHLEAELHNLYGPTEAAVDVTYWACQRDSDRQIVPIGRPIANTQMYILDQHLQPLPIGIPGELHIGGVQVARGYLNRPELTQEKFIPDPFSNQQEARLYKTGDLTHYLPDGNIEYLGRIDFQVKIRGFRIELGEIEAVLTQHSTVREAVVTAHEETPGDKRLVAYVVPKQQTPLDPGELRDFLSEKLPDYMVPAVFMVLETLPLSPNGKVDRRALPEPKMDRSEQQGTYVPPRTPTEKTVAKIWTKTLRVEKIGVHDNFFELGGHSLLAAQVFSQLRDVFGVKLELSSFFKAPTIAELAAIIEDA